MKQMVKYYLVVLTFFIVGCGDEESSSSVSIDDFKPQKIDPSSIREVTVDSSPLPVRADGFNPPPSPETRLRKSFGGRPMINRISKRYGVEPYLTHAIISQESVYKPTIGSPAGAVGLMQLISSTGLKFGCANRKNAECNVKAGVKYLKFLANKFRSTGNIQTIAAGYNAGEGAAASYLYGKKRKGINPQGRKTQNGVPVASFGYSAKQKQRCSGVNDLPGYQCEGETYHYARNVAGYYLRYKSNPGLIKMGAMSKRRPSVAARIRGRM